VFGLDTQGLVFDKGIYRHAWRIDLRTQLQPISGQWRRKAGLIELKHLDLLIFFIEDSKLPKRINRKIGYITVLRTRLSEYSEYTNDFTLTPVKNCNSIAYPVAQIQGSIQIRGHRT